MRFFTNRSEQQALLANDSERNSECQRKTRMFGWIGLTIGAISTTAGAIMYLLSDKNLHPENENLAQAGVAVAFSGLVVLGIGVSTLLINKCRETLEQRQHENITQNMPQPYQARY